MLTAHRGRLDAVVISNAAIQALTYALSCGQVGWVEWCTKIIMKDHAAPEGNALKKMLNYQFKAS